MNNLRLQSINCFFNSRTVWKVFKLLLVAFLMAACALPGAIRPTATGQSVDLVETSEVALLPFLSPAVQSTVPEPSSTADSIPAFPGAEGFGAVATGGRGGVVLAVTTLDPDPGGVISGSLNWALRQSGPRTIVFRVSGLIDGYANIVHGDVTIAGQTSPGGIVVRGLVCDGHYERNSCDNLIIRHIRSRPAPQLDGAINALDDALRMDGVQRFIIDHSSFANASDEAIQISWAMSGTIQYSILGETVGSHYDRGGMLINYSLSEHPQDNLSIHHNLWYRIGGRMPEITCESSAYPGDGGSIADCASHPLHLEVSSNLMWDPEFLIWYNRFVDNTEANGPYRLQMNMVSNSMVVRPGFPYGMMVFDLLAESQNSLYIHDNHLSIYPDYQDGQLAYCCNDFAGNAPNTDPGAAAQPGQRHPFPTISYTTAAGLQNMVQTQVGAFPRDPLDRRYMAAIASGVFDPTPLDQPGANDAFAFDFNAANPPAPLVDSDQDGMPDAFEQAHGLNPAVQDQNGSRLSVAFTGVAGYTNLDCYLNKLSDDLVGGGGGVLLDPHVFLPYTRR